MNTAAFLIAALPLASAMMAALLFCFAWPDRRRPTGLPVLVLLASAGSWAFFYALEILAPACSTKVLMAQCQYLGIVFVAPSWCLAAARLTGHAPILTPSRVALYSAIPFVTAIAALSNQWHGLLWRKITLGDEPVPLLHYHYGPIFWINNQYAWLLLLTGSFLLLRGAWGQYRVLTIQGTFLILAILAPWVANGLYIFKVGPMPNLDLTPCAFIVSSIVLLFGITRLSLTRTVLIAREYVLEYLHEALFVIDNDGRLLDTNVAGERLLDAKKSAIVGLLSAQVFARFPFLAELASAEEEQTKQFKMPGDEMKTFEARSLALFDASEVPLGRIITCNDISARVRADEDLRQSEEQFRIFIESAPAGVAMLDRELRYLAYSRRWLADYGLEGRDLRGIAHYEVFPEITERWKEIHRRCLQGVSESCEEDRFVRADGSVQYLRWKIQPWHDHSGAIGGLVFFTEDISERILGMLALRESEERFRVLIEDLNFGVVLQDKHDRVLIANRAAQEILGLSIDDFGQISSEDPRWNLIRDDGSAFPPDAVPSVVAVRTKCPVRNVLVGFERIDTHVRRWIQVTAVPRLDEYGEIVHLLVTMSDVSEKRLAEQSLRDSEDRLRRLNERFSIAVESAGIGVWELDFHSNELYWDKAMYAMYDVAPDEHDSTLASWYNRISPLDLQRVVKHAMDAIECNVPYDTEFRVTRGKGELRHIRSFGRTVFNAQGKPDRLVGINYDVTRQRQLEEQLSQSQKMQAIGQLAGGVAHDFNNILTIINGYSDLLLSGGISSQEHLREKLEYIRQAGERAAMLTQRLLLFSRKAQLKPGMINVNDSIKVMGGVLRRTIEEHIQLILELTAVPTWANLDPSQFEQILLNLCINARDAMTVDGGQLRIITEVLHLGENELAGEPDVKPGEYVRIQVVDSGCGMAPEVIEHIFEPFFTTKEVGKGTGLGLAMVYGVVRECGGFVRVSSAPGAGSSFSVFLPAIVPPQQGPATRTEPVDKKHGRESVLLVEDETPVREMIRECLNSSGYRVCEARDGVEATEMYEGSPESFDLLITDVIMPRRGGLELVKRIREITPTLPVIFISGYPGADYDSGEATDPLQRFLQKPFAPMRLLVLLRELLER